MKLNTKSVAIKGMIYSIKMYITIKIILFINYSANKSFLNVSALYILDINPFPFETVIVT